MSVLSDWPADVQRIQVIYEVVVVRRHGWEITYSGPSRYAAASEYNRSPEPKRMIAIGKRGGLVLHEQPEPTQETA